MEMQAIPTAQGWRPPVNAKPMWPVAGPRFGPDDKRAEETIAQNAAGVAGDEPWGVNASPAGEAGEAEVSPPRPHAFRSEYRYDEGRSFIELLHDVTERVLWTVPARAVIDSVTKNLDAQPPGARLNAYA